MPNFSFVWTQTSSVGGILKIRATVERNYLFSRRSTVGPYYRLNTSIKLQSCKIMLRYMRRHFRIPGSLSWLRKYLVTLDVNLGRLTSGRAYNQELDFGDFEGWSRHTLSVHFLLAICGTQSEATRQGTYSSCDDIPYNAPSSIHL